MAVAKEIHKTNIRNARTPKLAELDIEFQKAQETSASIAVRAKVDGSITDIFYVYESPTTGYYHHLSGSHVIALNAGQTHEFHATAAGFHISNETNFSACLIQAY